MPIYEYRCTSCGHEIEVIQKVGERRLRTCKRCSGKLEKKISRTSFLLKGGGWYTEGYHKDSGKKSKAADKPAKAGEGTKKKAAKSSGD